MAKKIRKTKEKIKTKELEKKVTRSKFGKRVHELAKAFKKEWAADATASAKSRAQAKKNRA